jgi:hypothetical protein
MIIFYFILIIILIVGIELIFQTTNVLIEEYTNQPNTIILIGDSILENKHYSEKSIVDYIEEENTKENTIICLAEDNSTIQNVIELQIPELNSKEYNNQHTYIFVSAGGNDILQKIVYRDNSSVVDPDTLTNIMDDYENLIKTQMTKMNKSNIILLNLYYPPSSFYRNYDSYIKKWNINVKDCAKKYNCRVLDLSEFMTMPQDFSHSIEPSDIGGKKMVDNMMRLMN